MKHLKHKIETLQSDFHADNLISFPIDQHITKEELDYIYEIIRKFMIKVPYVDLSKHIC